MRIIVCLVTCLFVLFSTEARGQEAFSMSFDSAPRDDTSSPYGSSTIVVQSMRLQPLAYESLVTLSPITVQVEEGSTPVYVFRRELYRFSDNIGLEFYSRTPKEYLYADTHGAPEERMIGRGRIVFRF